MFCVCFSYMSTILSLQLWRSADTSGCIFLSNKVRLYICNGSWMNWNILLEQVWLQQQPVLLSDIYASGVQHHMQKSVAENVWSGFLKDGMEYVGKKIDNIEIYVCDIKHFPTKYQEL